MMENKKTTWFKDLCILTLLLVFSYSLFLGTRPLTPPDEGRYSEIPREMVISGDYVTPYLNGVKYLEKPVLFYWLQALSIKAFGINEGALRLVTTLMGVFGALLTYWGARQLFDRRAALLATCILSSSLLYGALAHFITPDMSVSVFLTGSFLCFITGVQEPPSLKRKWLMLGMYLFAALATMTKGLIGIIFPGAVIFSWLLITREWRQLKACHLVLGTCIFLAITLPWHIAAQIKNPEFFSFYFYEQHFLRYFTPYADRQQRFWFLPMVLMVGFLPWSGFLLFAVKDAITRAWRAPKNHQNDIFLLLWAGMIFLFYYCSRSQLSPYILPIFPPLAILTGQFVGPRLVSKSKSIRFSFWVAACISVLLLPLIAFAFHHQPHVLSKVLIAGSVAFFSIIGAISYEKKKPLLGIAFLVTSSFILLIIATLNHSFYETRSVKQLALQLKKIYQPTDVVYHFSHYYQDFPVYLGHQVKIVNWTGELTYGSEHQDCRNIFLNQVQLYYEWPTNGRKFMVIKKDDLVYIKNMHLNFKVLGYQNNYALICNQEIQ